MTIDHNLAPHLHNFVLIEGGHRAVTKYKRLMLRRIKWTIEEEDEEMEESEGSEKAKESNDMKCHLVWEGGTNVP